MGIEIAITFAFPLMFIAMIVGVVIAIRYTKGDESITGIGTTRRLFLYGLAFVSLMLATSGLTFLVSSTLGGLFESTVGRRGDSGQTAFGLAATIVGFPVWLLLFKAGAKSLVAHPAEAGSLGRKLYLYSVMMIAAVVVAITASQTLTAMLGLDNIEPSQFAAPMVWAVVWYFHWRTEANEGQPSAAATAIRWLYVYLTSSYGLQMLAVGSIFFLQALFSSAYANLFTDSILTLDTNDLWGNDTRASLAIALVGGGWWWFHWYRAAHDDHTSGFRLAAVYVFGIFGGLVLTISGISIAIFSFLNWVLGGETNITVAMHFDALPAAVAISVTGVALWIYHRLVSQEDAIENLQRSISGDRVYRYLSAAVGLATMAIGISVLIGVIVGFLAGVGNNVIFESRWWTGPLTAAFTSMIVGAPLWVRHWLRNQVAADFANPAERGMLSRRAYMFSVFGIAVLATLISASIVLFQLLQVVLEGELQTEILSDVRWGLGIVITAALVSFYHWQVMKVDRTLDAEPKPAPVTPRKKIFAVGSSAARSMMDSIALLSNATLTMWERRDNAGVPKLTSDEISIFATQVAEAPGESVLLIIDASVIQVIPIE